MSSFDHCHLQFVQINYTNCSLSHFIPFLKLKIKVIFENVTFNVNMGIHQRMSFLCYSFSFFIPMILSVLIQHFYLMIYFQHKLLSSAFIRKVIQQRIYFCHSKPNIWSIKKQRVEIVSAFFILWKNSSISYLNCWFLDDWKKKVGIIKN